MAAHLFLRLINFIIVGLLMSCSLHLPFFFIFFLQQSSCAATLVYNPAPQYNDVGTSHVITNYQSFLELPRGLNLSILPSYNATNGSPLSYDLMFTAVMPGLLADDQYFFPILSSPSVYNVSYSRSGFSLGFYFWPDQYSQAAAYNVYLAVCAVFPANYTIITNDSVNVDLYSSSYGTYIYPGQFLNVYVVPVWIANLNKPIKDWQKASLGVGAAPAAAADSSTGAINILQLKEGDEIVWNVSNVGMMEMRDTGDLLIFSHNSTSPSSRNVVWESFDTGTARSDILVQGQKLTVGGELRSNDSNYLARMEKGGLVLYLNNDPHFDGTVYNTQQGLQQPPYWIFPMFNPSAPANASINHLISTAPCTNSPAFTVLDQLNEYGGLPSTSINMDPGSICSNLSNSSIFSSLNADNAIIYLSFLRLENDGRLYVYTVYNPASGAQLLAAPSVTRAGLDSLMMSLNISSYPLIISQGGPECDVPMACGPGGVCTPGAKTLCSCPLSYFEPRNNSDFSQGCKRQTRLPVCTTSNFNSTDFLQLNSTASIFLFNGWSFNPTHAPLAYCKSLCSSTCSCNGFFYVQAAGHNSINDSACFFITDEFTLLNVVDKTTLFVLNYTSSVSDFQQRAVIARNYATYLKVVISGSSATAENILSPAATTKLRQKLIMPTIVAAILVIGMASIAAYRLFRSRKRKSAQIRMQAEEEKELQDILPLLPSRFSYKDLHEATKGFSNLLGAGGCGSVYSGILWDGRKVAVKVLQVVLKGAEQSRQFLAEVGTIGRTSHHNIVRLYGFCWELSHRLLVYEYVERGSLDHWLFNVDDGLEASQLDWQTRYNVALGIGRGMHYLHEECEQPILHFDIKPQNILLGDDFVAKLADFGMSRLIQRDASSVVTGVRGTPGYIAPEWLSHGKVSKKSDIFSMGMVLLELVGGRKILDYSLLNSSLDPVEQEAWHLPSWGASKCAQGLMMELVDKRLHVCGFDGEQAQRLIHIAFWCIHNDPTMRPSALTVVQWLEGIPPRRCPPFSTVINAALDKPQATNSVYDDETYHNVDHISMY